MKPRSTFITTIERKWSNCIVCISFRNIVILHLICNHWFCNHIKINDNFRKILHLHLEPIGFSDLISAIRLSAIAINFQNLCFIIHSFINHDLDSTLQSNDSIKVASSEIQIEAFAFISAVQSVNVNDWSAVRVPICTSPYPGKHYLL
jgi:hypothetical protein